MLLSLFAKYCVLPGSPQSQAADGHAQRHPPSSSESGWRHCSSPRWFCDTRQHFHTPMWFITSDISVCRHTQAHLCLFLKDRWRDRGREIEMLMISSWQMVEWFSEDWYYCPLTLVCCSSNPQHHSKAGLIASTVSLSPTQRCQLSCEMHRTLTSTWINNRECAPFCLFEQHSCRIFNMSILGMRQGSCC